MKNVAVYLLNILDAITRIEEYTEGFEKEDFLNNKLVQDAVIRNFEIIGEATKNISTTLRDQYVSMPWASMAGMRDKLIHHYMGVDLEIVWNTIEDVLPYVEN